MTNFLESFLPYLPYLAFAAVVIGVILIVSLILISSATARRRNYEKALASPPIKGEGRASTFFKRSQDKAKSCWQTLRRRWSLDEKDEISGSFRRTREIFKNYLGGLDAQYKLPWYIMIGAEDSGKSTILRDMDLELPIGNPDYPVQGRNASINWAFYNQGVVIDVNGELILEKNSLESDQNDWDYLLRMLVAHRAKRPLDGIILTISVEELIGDKALGENALLERAQAIGTKLHQLQSQLSLHIPVYVIFTKSDAIPGFESFAYLLPSERQQEMLGWSSPYPVDVSYNDGWVDEIFSYFKTSLDRLRLEILSNTQTDIERDELFKFPVHFCALQQKVGLILNTIFQNSSYFESCFLRGVYFSGQSLVNDVEIGTLFPEKDEPRLGDLLEDSPQHVKDPLAGRLKKRVIFLKDLFEKKIFKEAALGRPVQRIISSTNRFLNYGKVAAAVFFGIWGIGLFQANHSLTTGMKSVLPALTEIEKAFQGIKDRSGDLEKDVGVMNYVAYESKEILDRFTLINKDSSRSLFLPLSWFSHLDQNIVGTFSQAYERIIFPAMHVALLKKGEEIVSKVRSLSNYQTEKHQYINPTMTPEFLVLKEYINKISDFESYAKIYNNITEDKDVKRFGELIFYLFNTPLQGDFFSHDDYYIDALNRANIKKVDIMPLKIMTGERTGALFREFLDRSFNINENFPLLRSLTQRLCVLKNLRNQGRVDSQDLRDTVQEAVAVADLISNGQLDWLDYDHFDPASDYEKVMHSIASSELLGKEVVEALTKIANQEFLIYRMELGKFKEPLLGSFFEMRNGLVYSEPSAGLVEFIDTMTAFLQEPFMQASARFEFKYRVGPNQLLMWDEMILKKAVALVDDYTKYVQQKAPVLPEKYQELVAHLGRNNVRELTLSNISSAETFYDMPAGMHGFGYKELLHSQVRNIVNVTPYFTKLLGVFEKGQFIITNAKLREFLISQSYTILERIEAILASDNLYSADVDNMRRWDGGPILAYLAFDVHDMNDLKNFVNAQRNRITYLGKELAQPILSLLGLGFLENVPIDLPLVERWNQIVRDLDDYEKKSPGTPLKVLEDFIIHDMNQVTSENCLSIDDAIVNSEGSGDYFLEVRNGLLNMVMKRCQNEMGRATSERYDRVVSFFNQNLAGRYPFTKSEISTGLEADPNDVVTFFELFDALTPGDIQIVNGGKGCKANADVAAFIRDVQSVRDLTLSASDYETRAKKSNGLKLDVTFRSDRNREVGGDKIIDWTMESGEDQVDLRSDTHTLSWLSGDPVGVDLRWAHNSDVVPLDDDTQANLSTMGTTATFDYTGRWALIALIRQHLARGNEAIGKPSPLLLEFMVPTRPRCEPHMVESVKDTKTSTAHVFVRMAIKAPPKEGDDDKKVNLGQPKLLGVPHFPYHAPSYKGS
jgi:type VI secretion system protein ImpL